jgi:ABC-type antimicrobial peptide transport system permease subunit
MVLLNACSLVASGLVIGGVAARYLSAASKVFLFRLEPTDPRAFGAAVVTLLVAALVASAIPARRAASVDPMEALRAE